MRLGRLLTLRVTRQTEHGVYLSDGNDEVLLPRSQTPPEAKKGDLLRVFVLTDSEDRPIATTRQPIAQAGEFARLSVISVTDKGAFLDLGLDKDLFCPFREQRSPLRVGDQPIVRIYVDETSGRLACSTRLNRFLQSDGRELKAGQEIAMLVAEKRQDLIGVIVDDRFTAALFPDEWVEALRVGDRHKGYVKSIRSSDGKVSVSLRPQGRQAVLGERERLLAELAKEGSLPFSDSSPAEAIQQRFGISKGAFKKLIGALYKEGKIVIESDHIRLS